MIDRLESFFARSTTRFLLAFLIILSVMPLPQVRLFDLLFFAVFAFELALRAALLPRMRGRRRALEIAILAVDAVAVLSFLPLPAAWAGSGSLRVVRLLRLSLLVGYASPLARDLWAIVSRREISRQIGFIFGGVVLLAFLAGIVLHAFDVPVDLDRDGSTEHGGLADLLWWSFMSLESQDNIAQNAKGPLPYIVFSVILTVTGVFIMSFIIGLGTSVVGELVAAGRAKPVGLSGHVVVIGRGRNVRYLLVELVRLVRKRREDTRVALLSDAGDAPAWLHEPELRGVEYRGGDLADFRSLSLVSPGRARAVIVLYDPVKGADADAHALSTVLALRENTRSHIFLEMRHRTSAAPARAAGGDRLTPVPLARMLGSILSQNLVFPGIDRLYEELLTAAGSDVQVVPLDPPPRAQPPAPGDKLPFARLLVDAYLRDGVILAGVMRRQGAAAVPRINPLPGAACDPCGGDGAGAVAMEGLAGLIGVAREKGELLRVRDRVARGVLPEAAEPPAQDLPDLPVGLGEHFTKLREVLVVGENESLPSLVEETTRFVPGTGFTVLVPGAGRAARIAQRLAARLGCPIATRGEDSPGGGGACPAADDRRVTVLGSDDDVLSLLDEDPRAAATTFDAAVFMADTAAGDPDAQNLLWIFRLMELAKTGRMRAGPAFHVLAEILSSAKGELVEKRFTSPGGERAVRALSTHKMRTYFMAHCCFTPELLDIYGELLSSEGCELCQLVPAGWKGRATFSRLLAALAREGIVLLGIQVRSPDGAPATLFNPRPFPREEEIDLARVTRVWAVADTDRFRGAAAGREP